MDRSEFLHFPFIVLEVFISIEHGLHIRPSNILGALKIMKALADAYYHSNNNLGRRSVRPNNNPKSYLHLPLKALL